MNDTTTTTRRSPALIIGASILCALGVAGAVTAMIFAFAGPASAHKTPVTPSHHAAAPLTPVTPVTPSTPHPHTNPAAPIALTVAEVDTLQRQLGQLNYYEGPVNGELDAQTVQSLKYLQRDADLPQNGVFDRATYLALQHLLATGNNQMAG
jgi:hypothetical protein